MPGDSAYPGPDFWQGKYDQDHTPWDLGDVSAPVKTLVEGYFPPAGRVFIPGCGRGHEALYLAALGYSVTALDIVAPPLEFLRLQAKLRRVEVETLHGDLFDLSPQYDGTFDVWLEQACLCALAPGLRAAYEAVAHRLLKPGGVLLGVFMEVPFDDGPPFNLPPEVVLGLFPPRRWEAAVPEPVEPQNPRRPGPEYLARFTRQG